MSRWCSGKVAIATTSNAQACCSNSAYGWNGLVYLQSTLQGAVHTNVQYPWQAHPLQWEFNW